jgi:hypothetical protein
MILAGTALALGGPVRIIATRKEGLGSCDRR